MEFLATYPEVVFCALLCVASAFRLLLGIGTPRKNELLLLASVFGFVGPMLAQVALAELAHFAPARMDYYVFGFDGVLGFEPSFAVGRLIRHFPLLKLAARLSYNGLAAAYVTLFAVYLKLRSENESAELALAFALNLFASLPIYLLFPVCGPVYAFPNFPFQIPAHVVAQAVAINAPPNGVPSVHFSSALLILWFCRHWKRGRVAASIFLVLTALATLGSGEHYLFDLVAALPYAALIGWAAHSLIFGARESELATEMTMKGA